jgi:SAM-dependent MidA family methyltransferase
LQALKVHLVETSPVLRKMQARLLEPSGVTPNWHETPAGLPEGATIIVANEFLDALPVHQFVSSGGKWFERQVGMSAKGELQFLRSSEPLAAPDILPRAMRNPARDGDIAEVRPGADELVRTIAARATGSPIAALFIDYGHGTSAPGDTLQAVRAHDYADPLARPGQADLTSHVDFGRLAETARAAGLRVHGPLTQGQFLLALGLSERCERLMEHAAEGDRGLIASGALRLADRAQMGELFKAMALASPELEPPPFTANSGPEPGK